MRHLRSHAFVLLALAGLFAAACGELRQQQAAEPSTAGETPVVAEDTATPPTTTATAAPEPSETPKAVEPTAAPPTAAPTPLPNRPDALSLTGGLPARGGSAYRFGRFTFVVPAGYDLRWTTSVSDPGGGILLILVHEPTGSVISIDPETGKENARGQLDGSSLKSAEINAVFDTLVSSIIVDG